MNIREGFRRIARVTAWLYWIFAAVVLWAFVANAPVAPRTDFSLRAPDGQTWQVSGYDRARAQAFLNSYAAPKLIPVASSGPNPSDKFDTTKAESFTPSPSDSPILDDEPNRSDWPALWRMIAIAVGVELAIYIAGTALFRALRWVALGFAGEASTNMPAMSPDRASRQRSESPGP